MDAGTAEAHARPGDLLGLDSVVLEGRDTRAAVLLGHLDAEKAKLGQLVVEIARDDASGEPLRVVRHDLGLDKGPQGQPEGLVVLVEHGTTHDSHSPDCSTV